MTNENINQLRQLIKARIEQTDSEEVLNQCLSVLSGGGDGDEIVETVSVTSQLRASVSDKKSLVSSALAARQQAVADELPAATDGPSAAESEAEETETVPSRRKWGAWVVTPLVALGVLAAGSALWSVFSERNGDTGAMKTVAKDYHTFDVGGVKFNMVKVEGGTFTMGASEAEAAEADSDELPAHEVTLTSYYIGETEVTQALWTAVTGESLMSADGDLHPMKNVSWDDCQRFIERLDSLTGLPFALPTEAQWEFAARGGTQSHHYLYPGGNDIEKVAWYSANSWDKGKGTPDFGNHEVGSKAPNELGLYDMAGNVWEWCQDSYGKYTSEPQTNPKGRQGEQKSFRVNRGGSWDYISTSARTTNRRNRTPDFRNFNLGLRLALPDGKY